MGLGIRRMVTAQCRLKKFYLGNPMKFYWRFNYAERYKNAVLNIGLDNI